LQLEKVNHRFRGFRESTELVEFAKSSPCDLKKVSAEMNTADLDYEAIRTPIDILASSRISSLQHLRAQIRFRLRIHTSGTNDL
jgi:hypothetical protein